MKQEKFSEAVVWPIWVLMVIASLGTVYLALGAGRSVFAYAIGFGILGLACLVTFVAICVIGWVVAMANQFLQKKIEKISDNKKNKKEENK